MISSDILDKITNKIEVINEQLSSNKNKYEIKLRIDNINSDLEQLHNSLEELEIEIYRNRKYLSDKTKNLIIENEKREKILETFLPQMTLYSLMQNDGFEDKYSNQYIENKLEESHKNIKDSYKKWKYNM